MDFKFFLFVFSLFLASCGHSVQKADIAATANPLEEIQSLEADINTAQKDHLDVLAPKDFRSTQSLLAEAKHDLKDGDSQREILNDIATARGYLNRARETASRRSAALDGVLKTREMAIQAGARQHPKHRQSLGKIDDDLREVVGDVGKISPQEFSNFQTRYMELELASLQTTHLGQATALVQGAKNDRRARKVAPNTLRKAELNLATAQNMISANRNKPEAYKSAVDTANASATLLIDVLNVAQKSGQTLDEDTAVGIVMNNRRISSLQTQLSETEQEALQGQQALETQSQDLAEAQKAIGMQASIESARQKFTSEEAEVYQQGEKLVIRLKAMNFPSGRSDLPASSLALLAKVKDVVSDLDPQSVVVEGHTDSIGGAKVNDRLSKARAAAVENYLETNGLNTEVSAVGYGFKKPIASNKSAVGRSQNRRVDVIVTPSPNKSESM